ncbi:CsbD family protein [Paraburkholderia sp. CNPSo 3272]|uniref:CsbD family protein n=1 Tax=Paraburkholderia sp. CNPSo 3272 TaxID=2940931 RepID=UPI0020B742AE|nr:CsbD family protein [Paraburkholderia sp. CNPSo 3272]MCP3726267.1 CsbD family protein [Paraburkholderia sp. CNPSo 3272]
METTKADGLVEEVAGSAKAAAGEVLGDPEMTLSGNAKALCGKSAQLLGDAADVARDALSESPMSVLGATFGIGLVIGALWAWNRH